MFDPAFVDLLRRVEKPGRYVGGEWNEVRKDPARVRAKVALAFPDVYEIGMSYLGQKILYGLLNREKDVLAERVFAPWPDLERELRSAGRPLVSLENGIPLRDFDIVGFSLLYELNFSNVLTMLDLGGIPMEAEARSASDPLVIAGGPAAFNPEPMARTFDLVFLGDGEEGFPEIVAAATELRRRGLPRPTVLRELSRIEGVYVPSLYRPEPVAGSPLLVPRPLEGAPARVRKRVLRRFSRSYFPERIVVPSLRVVFDRVAVEAARGCPQNCRFCQATSVYFPHRPKDPEFLRWTALRSLRQTGYEDLSLSALSISDYPDLDKLVGRLMGGLAGDKISLSLPSLRPGGLSREIVAQILRVRKTGFTLVPEAGTERLRRVINKTLDDAEIEKALRSAFEAGWKLVKLYFMTGLPTETEEDLAGIVRLVEESLSLGRSILGVPPRIHVSVSSFIPKPHTPFQWLGMESEEELVAKQDFLKAALRRHRTVELKLHSVRTSVLEAVFSRGDRRLGRVLAEAWRRGARFDGWDDKLDGAAWDGAFEAEGINRGEYLGPLPRDADLPWGVVDTGLRKEHLIRELELALRGERSKPCRERSCAECRGCDIPAARIAPRQALRTEAIEAPPSPIGRPAGDVVRYRAFYVKRDKARFLSHIDLVHVLQRSFRRAGIEVRKTQGFHPKLDMTYGPALPLGMESRREVLEFRSSRLFDPGEFLTRINKALPRGLRFIGLVRLERDEPSLSRAMEKLVYSLDWKSLPATEPLDAAGLKRALESFKETHPEVGPVGFRVSGRRIRIEVPASSPKGWRVQDIVRTLFNVEEAPFLLRREDIVLRPSKAD